MKKFRNILSFVAISATVFGLASCEKDGVVDIGVPVPTGASVKFYNASPNSPSVLMYINDVKYTSFLSNTGAEIATGVGYAGVYPGLEYVNVPAGQSTIAVKVPAKATANPGVTINTTQTNFEANKTYTVFLSDMYDATNKKSGAFITVDNIPGLDTSKTYIRFVQAIPNASTNFDIAAKQTNAVPVPTTATTLITDIAYKGSTQFMAIPSGVYEFYLRAKGTTTDLATLKAFGASKGKVYTIVARGDNAAAAGTTNVKTLDYYTTR